MCDAVERLRWRFWSLVLSEEAYCLEKLSSNWRLRLLHLRDRGFKPPPPPGNTDWDLMDSLVIFCVTVCLVLSLGTNYLSQYYGKMYQHGLHHLIVPPCTWPSCWTCCSLCVCLHSCEEVERSSLALVAFHLLLLLLCHVHLCLHSLLFHLLKCQFEKLRRGFIKKEKLPLDPCVLSRDLSPFWFWRPTAHFKT